MKIMRAFALVLLAGFPNAAFAAGSDEYAGIHSVGIISAIGDRLTLSNIGTTIMDNSKHEVPIADWGLDEMIVQRIAAAIETRFTVKQVTADTGEIEDPNYGNDLGSFVLSLPESNAVDAYIIVKKDTCADICSSSSVPVTGLGLVRRHIIFASRYFLHALFHIAVVDAKTGKVIDYGTGMLSGNVVFGSLPLDPVDNALWSDTAAGMTELQRIILKKKMTAMLQISVDVALHSVKLKPSGP